MEQDVEQRLARMEKRVVGAVVYSSVALVWIIIRPEFLSVGREFGVTEWYAELLCAALAGVCGVGLGALFMKKTSN